MKLWVACAVGVAVLVGGYGDARAAQPFVPKPIEFTVKRNGMKIGKHRTSFSRRGEELNVKSSLKLDVKALGLSLYKFNWSSQERWQDNALKAISVSINDNGKTRSFQGTRQGQGFEWTKNGKRKRLKRAIMPSSYWNPMVLSEKRALNTLSGNVNKFQVGAQGQEVLRCRFGSVQATRYTISGGINVQVWYDASGRWVGLRFPWKDGSTIHYEC